MKLTKALLRTIIKEEISSINEQDDEKDTIEAMVQNLQAASKAAMGLKSLGFRRAGLLGTMNGLIKILQALGGKFSSKKEAQIAQAHRISKNTLKVFSRFSKSLGDKK